MLLSVENITKNYKETKALDNVSFKIKEGEIIGLLGKNGAGKSTLMKIITGYILPSQGNVFINNEPLNKKIQSRIGYLPECNPLYNDMYVLEYLDFFSDVYKIVEKEKRINYLIELCSLQKVYKKKIYTLSKGNKQRVGIARVLLHNPDILILDEPISGLDPEQIINMLEIIKTLSKDKIVLFSTHILQEIIDICSRIIVINNGGVRYDFLTKECNIDTLKYIFNS